MSNRRSDHVLSERSIRKMLLLDHFTRAEVKSNYEEFTAKTAEIKTTETSICEVKVNTP